MFTHIFEKRNFDIDSLPWKQTQRQPRKNEIKKSKIKNRLWYIFRFLYKGIVLAEPLQVARRTPGFPRKSLISAVLTHLNSSQMIFNLGMIYKQWFLLRHYLCMIIITYLIPYLLTHSRHRGQSLRS
jgi:hypothetical protein